MKYKIIVFNSIYEAMAFEEAATPHGLEGRLIPLPSILSEGCGMAWQEPSHNQEALEPCLRGCSYQKMVEMDM